MRKRKPIRTPTDTEMMDWIESQSLGGNMFHSQGKRVEPYSGVYYDGVALFTIPTQHVSGPTVRYLVAAAMRQSKGVQP